MKYRKLRIAFSAMCGVVCLLLVALWVRSYWQFDQFAQLGRNRTYYGCTSAQGRILLGKSNDSNLYTVFGTQPIRRHFSLKEWDAVANVAFFPATVSESKAPAILPWLKFQRDFYIQYGTGTSYEITLPYWLLAVTISALGLLPWLPYRFSLRTLLIGMTVLAVALGRIIAARQ
jgi:hypothetical protein